MFFDHAPSHTITSTLVPPQRKCTSRTLKFTSSGTLPILAGVIMTVTMFHKYDKTDVHSAGKAIRCIGCNIHEYSPSIPIYFLCKRVENLPVFVFTESNMKNIPTHQVLRVVVVTYLPV